MAADQRTTLSHKTWQTLSSIKTGVILLIVVVIVSAAGTMILQRPVTDPDEMQRAYSPQTLAILDKLGLTDIFHAWWFVALLGMVSLSIIAASVERFPNAWRYFARPYKYPDESFRHLLPVQKQIPVPDEETGLVAVERALHGAGFRPERVVSHDHLSVFAERNRISEMAVYIVHASLLLIFFGGIVDALWGWRGNVNLTKGEQSNIIAMQNGTQRVLPFAVRCDGAGQENYADGSPKKWWSQLAVVKDGREVQRKQIVVNDPLVYGGVRFYQASYGSTGKVEKLELTANLRGSEEKEGISLSLNETAALGPETTIHFVEFIPDYVVQDGHVYTRSTSVQNPAAHLVMVSRKAATQFNVWLPPIEGFAENERAPYQIEAQDLKLGYFTGLQVSHEPGQWAVWAGVILMGIGLSFVFYVAHVRFWAVPVRDARGKLSLWVGGTANRNRDAFEQRFCDLTKKIEAEVKAQIDETRTHIVPIA